MASCINMQDYVDKYKRLTQRIIGAGGNIDEALRQAQFEKGLTNDYMPFISMINTCMPNENRDTFDKISKLFIDQEYQLAKQGKQVNAVMTTSYKPNRGPTKRSQFKNCQICGIRHKGACLVEKGEISSHWSADAQERMKRRIQEYKEKRRNASPITTSIEAQRSQKRRKGNNKQEPIITFITLPPPKSIDTLMEANRSQKLREGYE